MYGVSIPMRRLVLVVLVAAAGCGGEPVPELQLRLAYDSPLVTLDPVRHDDRVTRSVLFSVVEPLVRIGPSLGVEPALAVAWDTPDSVTWRLRLREGVRFHDGSPLRPEDAVASLRRALEDPKSALVSYLTSVASIEVDGGAAARIVIRTRRPAPLLLTRLALVGITPGGGPPGPSPVGTGPYRWVCGDLPGPIVLERWEGYWGRRPDAARVVIRVLDTDDHVLEAVARDAVDVVEQVSPAVVAALEPLTGWHVERLGFLTTGMLGCNLRDPVLADRRVREAIDLAVDRQRLVIEAGSGDKMPAETLVPPGILGSRRIRERGPGDGERARELLRRAGYPGGVTVELLHAAVEENLLAELKRQLGRAGITLRLEQRPWNEVYRRILAGETQLFLWSWSFPFGDVSDFLDSVVHSRDERRGLGVSNGTGYADPELDRWIEEAAAEVRSEARLELLHRAVERVTRDRPYIPLYHRSRLVLLREGYSLDGGGLPWVLPQAIRIRSR